MSPEELRRLAERALLALDAQPTLRDRFAMAALQGLLASVSEGSRYIPNSAACDAYAVADAMLAERSKGQP